MRKILLAAILVLATGPAQAMRLSSAPFANAGRLALAQVDSRCGGSNRSPALEWSGAPQGARSYAITMFDPDAGGGRGFWHWLVFNIAAGAAGLPEGAGSGNGLPKGAMQAENDFGEAAYGGACPPPGSGIHHYEFTLYALDVPNAPFGAQANAADLSAWLKAHALATATLVGLYAR
jgi:Raf kinase inhibitor-like YbhB/YbcL family protein